MMSSSSNESSHVSLTSLAAVPTEVLRILNHLPVQLTFTKLTTKCYQNWALQWLKNSEKRRWQENDKIVKKSTQDPLAGASLLFFLLAVVPRATSPVTRVSRLHLTKMRNAAPEEEAGNWRWQLVLSKHVFRLTLKCPLFLKTYW